MRLLTLLGIGFLVSACASESTVSPCDLSDDRLASLKSNVRDYLRVELGDTYTYYDTEDSVLDATLVHDRSCAILIYPGGDSDDGSMLLHGEGVVVFDPESLTPSAVEFYVY